MMAYTVDMKRLKPKEREVMNHLRKAWNAYLELPEQHPCDRAEFLIHIHDCQSRVMLRAARKAVILKKTKTKGL